MTLPSSPTLRPMPLSPPWASPDRRSVEHYQAAVSPPKTAPQSRSSTDAYHPQMQSYEPAMVRRTASPSSLSVRSTQSARSQDGSIRGPYAPPESSISSFGARYRSMSNGSAFSVNGVNDDPYAPSHHSSAAAAQWTPQRLRRRRNRNCNRICPKLPISLPHPLSPPPTLAVPPARPASPSAPVACISPPPPPPPPLLPPPLLPPAWTTMATLT